MLWPVPSGIIAFLSQGQEGAVLYPAERQDIGFSCKCLLTRPHFIVKIFRKAALGNKCQTLRKHLLSGSLCDLEKNVQS